MNENDIDRLQSDLAVMRGALGMDLAYSEADVRFLAAMSAAAGLYALFSWPGATFEVAAGWAAAPLLSAIVVYLAFMAVRSRTLPPREVCRRREYRSSLLATACVVPATLAAVAWSKQIGMTPIQLGASLLGFMGVAFLVIGIATPPVRYPRSIFIGGAIPLVVFALLIPLAPPRYSHCLIGLMGLVECGLAAVIYHRGVRRHRQESGAHVGS